jgi:hypothetical protein
MLFPVHSAPRATDVSLLSTTARLRALCRRGRICVTCLACRGLTCMIRSCSSQSLVPESLLRHFHALKHSTHLPIPACRWLLRWCRGQPLLVRRHHEVGLPRCAPLRSRHLSPLHSEKAEPSGASTADAAVAPSHSGNGAHGQGIGDNVHANTVATKEEGAAAQAHAKQLKAMTSHKAMAQKEADATYAGPCARAPSMH